MYICTMFGILLGHIIFQHGLLANPTDSYNSKFTSTNYSKGTMTCARSYKKFIKGYVGITTPLEKLLKSLPNISELKNANNISID